MLQLPLQSLVELTAGVLILLFPRLLSYIVALALVLIGALGLIPTLMMEMGY